MPERFYQHEAREDGCVYVYDYDKKKWLKYCDVTVEELPESVRAGVHEDRRQIGGIPV